LPVDQVVRQLETDEDHGLTSDEASARLKHYGRNELAQAPSVPWWKRLARQFADVLIWILIAAAIISGALGEWLDAGAIIAIVILNGLLGFIQEGRAEQALAALQKLSSPQSRVIRDGRLQIVPASELVPGDRINLEAGDRVPADARLLSSASLRVDEAILTGESVPDDKDSHVVLDESTLLGDRSNMAYMGTSVTAGSASAVIVATGMDSEIGHIAGLLEQQRSELTPLQKRLAELGKTLIVLVLGIVAVIFALQLLRGGNLLDAFLLSVSLAVAAVPEGLAAVVTVALALGLQRMARRNGLIRRLPSVETLGSVTVICSDKTGTLTRNQMTVQEIVAGGRRFNVTGSGYEPTGEFHERNDFGQGTVTDPGSVPDLIQALTVGAWCSHAQITKSLERDDQWELVGDPTEGALVVAALKAGVSVTGRDQHIVQEIPFDSDRKAMSVVVAHDDKSVVMYTKGAPEVVLGKCTRELRDGEIRPLGNPRRDEILRSATDMAGRALRVLGLAYRNVDTGQDLYEQNLVFVGLIGMIDPPRDEARTAIQRCQTAGIRPVMITGDHPDTARAVAQDLGILNEGERLLTGIDLDRMSAEGLVSEVERVSVYARVTAAHKLQIVNAWRARAQVVAMTGDGVNDAPAIKAADVGIAMGITGTDVTKEASDMVLVDDNFASIVNAVEEGRTIYDNIRKFVNYLLATNAGEVLLMLFATIVGWPVPLIAIQILWINLVTDALPAMALGVEPSEPDVMNRPPRPPGERVLTSWRGVLIVAHGALNAAAAAVVFYLVYGGYEDNLPAARTATFCTLAFSQLFFAFGCRSERYTLPQLGLFSNPWLIGAIAVSSLLQLAVVTVPPLQSVFKGAPITAAQEWGIIVLFALLPVTVIELRKLLRGSRQTES
jgi:Ca2+-transporting ATPase